AMRHPVVRSICASLLFLLFPISAAAQLDTGVITGAVTDSSGAVLPGVTITATQDETGVATSVVTNASGQYVFPGLRVGLYTVAAELQGFRRAVQREIRLSVQDRRAVDFALEVGALS